MFRQALSKIVNQALLKDDDRRVKMFFSNADRTYQNALEQMPLFLTALCLYALLCNPYRASVIAMLYCILIALYPYLAGTRLVALSTMPRYLMILYMIWAMVIVAAFGDCTPPPQTVAPTPAPPTHAPPTALPTRSPTVRGTPSPTPPPTPRQSDAHYMPLRHDVYSNNKYLADFQCTTSLTMCKDMCNNWELECPKTCTDFSDCPLGCNLADNATQRHYNLTESCNKKCIGFIYQLAADTGQEHCTLYSHNVEIIIGGTGTYYVRPGHDEPLIDWPASSIPQAVQEYSRGPTDVYVDYTTCQYLADFHSVMFSSCQHYCTRWSTVCPVECKDKVTCGLADEVTLGSSAPLGRHYPMSFSCTQKCIGFTFYSSGRCTLFTDNVVLRDGGSATFYVRPGFTAPVAESPLRLTHTEHDES